MELNLKHSIVNENLIDNLPKKVEESAEKKQSLEELLAVPFNQIKSDWNFNGNL